MTRKVDFNLYLITDRRRTAGRSLKAVVREALSGGVRAVQLREKDLPLKEVLLLAESLRTLTQEYKALLVINDRIDVCLAVGADGVHLNKRSLPIPSARKILGPRRLIGYSAHSVSEVIEAEAAGADFVVLGPVYDTPSKRGMGKPIGVEALHRVSKSSSLPVFAIGGITLQRAEKIFQTGIHGIAVISAILEKEDAEGAAFALKKKLKNLWHEGVAP